LELVRHLGLIYLRGPKKAQFIKFFAIDQNDYGFCGRCQNPKAIILNLLSSKHISSPIFTINCYIDNLFLFFLHTNVIVYFIILLLSILTPQAPPHLLVDQIEKLERFLHIPCTKYGFLVSSVD
jgi:hypothetical protein